MFGNYDICERLEEKSEARLRNRELLELAEMRAHNEYQKGQSAGLIEGRNVGYEKGRIEGIRICLQILKNLSQKPENLAAKFDISVELVNEIILSSR